MDGLVIIVNILCRLKFSETGFSARRNKLISNSVTVFLDVSLQKLEIRLSRSKNRPLLKNIDILSKLKELDTQRRKYYLDSNIKIQDANSINKTYLDFIEYFSNINDQNNQT